MFIKVNAIENLDYVTHESPKTLRLINVNDIFTVIDHREPDGSPEPGNFSSVIELRGAPRASGLYPRVQLMCEENIEEIQSLIQRALSPQRSSSLQSRS